MHSCSQNRPAEPLKNDTVSLETATYIGDRSLHNNGAPFNRGENTESSLKGDSSRQDLHPPLPPFNAHLKLEDLPDHGYSVSTDRYAGQTRRIEDEQEDLRDARDELVGQRFRLQSKRRELRVLRETSSSRSGAAFSLIQKHLFKTGLELSPAIKEVLDEVDQLRDRFGTMENDYEKAEEEYNLQEWKYTQKETTFIENLPGNEPLSYNPFRKVILEAGPAELTRFATGPSISPGIRVPVVSHELADLSPSTARSETALGVVNEVTTLGLRPHLEYAPIEGSWKTEPFHTVPHIVKPRPHSEADVDNARLNWPDTRNRIEQWLLGTLSDSPLQKTRLKEMLPQNNIEYDAWWELVTKHWNSDSPEISVFHTGDTTILESSEASQDVVPVNSTGILNTGGSRIIGPLPDFPPLQPSIESTTTFPKSHYSDIVGAASRGSAFDTVRLSSPSPRLTVSEGVSLDN